MVTPLSPWKGEREQPSCVFLRSDVAPTGTARSAIQRLGTRTTQRARFATARRAILPLPKGEGRGEGEATLETPMRLRTVDELNYAHLMTPPDVADSGKRSS